MKKIIYTENAPEPIGPYSQAILSGQTLYISGQIAINPQSGNLISDSIENETHQVMKNIGAILDAAGTDYSNVVKCSIFVSDMNDFSAINGVYGSYFDANPPARETVEVSTLPKHVNVEISCIATIG
jgi:2-iminobutanoate/2-iminopropanoate deaminase